MICCFLCTSEAVEKLLESDEATKPSTLLKIRHEKVRDEKFENLEMRV